jgi:phosphoribosylamine--glycine ligase
MRVVVVGGGGREHALVHVLAKSADEVIATPGNAGIPNSVATPAVDLDADLFVIGPEVPLVDGLADELRAQGKVVFGPGKDGAQLEGSKTWMKELFTKADIPTARWGEFYEVDEAVSFLGELSGGYVIKTDGLAAGKGVLVTENRDEAEADVRAKLSGESFGEAGRRVVIEEKLVGPEFSVFAICDGKKSVCLQPAQDHKRIGDGDTGPNTGGVGSYSPVSFLPPNILNLVSDKCITPTLQELQKRGIDYRGVLYGGFMLTDDGPKMLEYNVRFGDPETQVVLPRVTSDVTQLLYEAASGDLKSTPTFTDEVSINVVLCSQNYPGEPRTGDVIRGLEQAEKVEGVTIFHAGTKKNEKGEFVTSGGRVINVMAMASTIQQARDRAYEAISHISWPGMHYRKDIAYQALHTA